MSQTEEENSGEDSRTREFLQLLGEHDAALRRYIFALVPHWADSQDLMQEVRLRLWDQFDRYDPAKDFGAWSRAIAYYLVLAYRERQTRRPVTLFGDTFMEAVGNEVASRADTFEARGQALRQCVQKLAEHARQLLLRCYEGEETLHQIADSLGRTYEGTRKSVFRIRQSLAKCIQQMLGEKAS